MCSLKSFVLTTTSQDALSRNNDSPLKIGAFNIQVFGEKKMSIQAVKGILVKVMSFTIIWGKDVIRLEMLKITPAKKYYI